jgi:hypothetical protein
MAWTAPKTWSVGEILTSPALNEQVRDNINWLANDKPRCSAVRSAALSIAHNTLTDVGLAQAEEYDVGNMHDPVSNSHRLTCPSGGNGLYLVTATVAWTTNAVGRRLLALKKTDVVIPGAGSTQSADPDGTTTATAAIQVLLIAGEYVSLAVTQTSGGNLNLTHARLQATWLAF